MKNKDEKGESRERGDRRRRDDEATVAIGTAAIDAESAAA